MSRRVAVPSLKAGRIKIPTGPLEFDQEHHVVFVNTKTNTGFNDASGRMIRRTCYSGSFGFVPAKTTDYINFDVNDPFDMVVANVPQRLVDSMALPDPIRAEEDKAIRNLILSIYRLPPETDRLVLDHICMALMHSLEAFSGKTTRRKALGKVDRAIDFMNAHLGDRITISELADVSAMSEFHFARSFKAATGMTPHQYLTQRRVEQAKAAIQSTPGSLAAIAAEFGFASQAHMTAVFSKVLGVTPGKLRG